MSTPLRAGACLLHLGGGFAAWSSCFVVLYALLSLGCEAGGGGWLRVALAVAWVAHLLALAALLRWQWRLRSGRVRGSRFALAGHLQVIAIALTAAAWIATFWIGWPVLALPPCAGGELNP